MDIKNNDLELNKMNMKKENTKKNVNLIETNKNNLDEDGYFYIMTLQIEGKRHQIKIFEKSNASELAFNFSKEYNLDFTAMKYLKKCIKQIILHFHNIKKNEMTYLLKDNSSIREVAEEEIVTDNSLKKSGTNKKNTNNLNHSKTKIKKNFTKNTAQNMPSNKQLSNNDINNKKNKKNLKEKNKQKLSLKINEKETIKSKINNIDDEGKIELKDYSIDCCLENESFEVFPPTEHTTKIEQKSSIKNSYTSNQKKNLLAFDKKKNSKNKKLIIINNNSINNNRINKNKNSNLNLNSKTKREKSKKNNDRFDDELKNILLQYKELNNKEKNRSRNKSKSKSKEKRFTIEKEKYFIKKNNYNNNHHPKSSEKFEKSSKNKTTLIDNKEQEHSKNVKNNKINKFEKVLTNMNEIKKNNFSNYYDYFIKKNFNNTLTKKGTGHKYQISYSLNRESNRSQSISHRKLNKNLPKKMPMRNITKKEKSMIHLNSLNLPKTNNNSKLYLNTILNKEYTFKETQKTFFKNKLKNKYNIIYKQNANNTFNKTINSQCLSSRNKLKNNNGRELFMEPKKVNPNGIKKMVTESLLSIHKSKVNNKDNKDKRKKNIYINNKIFNCLNNTKKLSRNREIISKNDTNIEKSIYLQEKLGNNNIIINNNTYTNIIS